jgi:Rieske Fe-S protein
MSETTGCDRRTALGILAAVAALPLERRLSGATTTQPAESDHAWVATVKAEQLEDGAADTRWEREHWFVLSRSGDKVVALDVRCTHHGCPVSQDGKKGFLCNCHGARYAWDGEVVKGPAKNPLVRYAVKLGSDGIIEVDTLQKVTSDDSKGVLEIHKNI